MQGINTTPNMDPKLQESLKNAASQRTANAQGTTSNTLDKNPSFRQKVFGALKSVTSAITNRLFGTSSSPSSSTTAPLSSAGSKSLNIQLVMVSGSNDTSTNVKGFMVGDKFVSFDDAREQAKQPTSSGKAFKTLLAKLDRGTQEKMKGSQQKIGSKLYIKDDTVSIKSGFFSSQKQAVGSTLNVAQLMTNLEQMNNVINNDLKQAGSVPSETLLEAKTKLVTHFKQLQSIAEGVPELKDRFNALENQILGSEVVSSLNEKLTVLDQKAAHSSDTSTLNGLQDNLARLQGTQTSLNEISFSDGRLSKLPPHLKEIAQAKVDHSTSTVTDQIKTTQTAMKDKLISDLNITALQDQVTQLSGKTEGPDLSPLTTTLASFKGTQTEIDSIKDWATTTQTRVSTFQKTQDTVTELFNLTRGITTDTAPLEAQWKGFQKAPLDLSDKVKQATSALKTFSNTLQDSLLTATKAKVATTQSSLKDSLQTYVSSKRGEFKFQTIFSNYLTQFHQRFGAIKTAMEKTDIGRHFSDKGISSNEINEPDTFFTKMQDLYIEKRFNALSRTVSQQQYDSDGPWTGGMRSDADIDTDMADVIKDHGLDSKSDAVKDAFSKTAESFVNQLSTRFEQEAHAFIIMSMTKDSTYAALRAQSVTIKALETASTQLKTSDSDPLSSIKQSASLYHTASQFEQFGTAYTVGFKQETTFNQDTALNIIDKATTPSSELTSTVKKELSAYLVNRLEAKKVTNDEGRVINSNPLTFDITSKKSSVLTTLSPQAKTALDKLSPQLQRSINTFVKTSAINQGQKGGMERMTTQLSKESSAIGQWTTSAQLKVSLWAETFKQSSLSKKVSQLSDLKSGIEDTMEEVGSEDESKLASTAGDATDALETVQTSSTELKEAITATQEKMTRAISTLNQTKELFGSFSTKGTIDTKALNSLTSELKGAADTVNDMAEHLAGTVGTAVDTITGSIPYYNQLESTLLLLNNIRKVVSDTSKMNRLQKSIQTVQSLDRYVSSSELDTASPEDVKTRISSFKDHLSTATNRDNTLMTMAFDIANLASPPGVKIGSLLSSIKSAFSLESVSDETLSEIATRAQTIQEGYSSVATGNATTAIELFLTRLKNSDLSMTDKGATRTDFYNTALSFQQMADHMVSADQVQATLFTSPPDTGKQKG